MHPRNLNVKGAPISDSDQIDGCSPPPSSTGPATPAVRSCNPSKSAPRPPPSESRRPDAASTARNPRNAAEFSPNCFGVTTQIAKCPAATPRFSGNQTAAPRITAGSLSGSVNPNVLPFPNSLATLISPRFSDTSSPREYSAPARTPSSSTARSPPAGTARKSPPGSPAKSPPLVRHADPHPFRFTLRRQHDPASLRRKLDRIHRQVHQHPRRLLPCPRTPPEDPPRFPPPTESCSPPPDRPRSRTCTAAKIAGTAQSSRSTRSSPARNLLVSSRSSTICVMSRSSR